MKKTILFIVMSLILILAACNSNNGSSSDGKSNDEKVTLRAATGNAITQPFVGKSFIPWMDEVTEITEDQVEFEFFSNGELVKLTQEIDGVLNGTVDVVVGYPNYQPDQFPLADVTMLPLEESDIFIATKAWKELLESDVKLSDGKTFYESQFSDKGLMALPLSMSPPYEIATTKKTFNSVNDIKGTSLRTPSSITENFAKHLGVNSISMPGGELYDALSRGAFDGSFISLPDWVGLGLQDLLMNELQINAGHFNAAIVMKQETFDKLPENLQEKLVTARENTLISGSEEWQNWSVEIKAEKEAAGAKFVKTTDVSQELQDYISEAKVKTWMEFIESREDKGIPGKSIAILWRDLIVKNGGKVPASIMELE